MAEKLPKIVDVALADDLRIVLSHLCEDWHLDPSIVIDHLCYAAIYCAIDSPDLCEEYLDAINRAYTESLNEILDLRCKAVQKYEYDLMCKLIRKAWDERLHSA
jgi:hypothetical protein